MSKTIVSGESTYILGDLIGSGGMGSVYRAFQQSPVKRDVVIKIINADVAESVDVLEYFEAEREALSVLENDHVSAFYDTGADDEGRPFLVMRLVKGKPITKFCDENRLRVEDRLTLFLQACKGVSYAHSKVLLHRDIKPSNVLAGRREGLPHAVVIDFGIAKAMAGRFLTSGRINAVHGAMVGTPHYMSPEQARGDSDIDTKADVYSLGVLLLELVAGVRLFADNAFDRRSLREIGELICNQEPVLPLNRAVEAGNVGATAKLRRTSPVKLLRLLKGDLGRIIAKACHPLVGEGDRFQSVEALAADILQYLQHRPLLSAAQTPLYRFQKYCRRNAFALAFAAVIAAAGAVGLWSYVRAIKAERHRTANALVSAERQELLARQRFDDVRSLASALLFGISDKLDNIAGTTPGREILAKTGIEYLKKLDSQSSGDVSLQKDVASGYIRVGDILGNPNVANLGDSAGAIDNYVRAVAIFEGLLRASPQDRDCLKGLSLGLERLADLLAVTGKSKDAKEKYERSLNINIGLYGETPVDGVDARRLSASCEKLGDINVIVGDSAAAQGYFQRSSNAIKAFVGAGESDPENLYSHAVVSLKLGDVELLVGNTEAARVCYIHGKEVCRQILLRNPQNAKASRAEMLADTALARVAALRADSLEAMELNREAKRIAKELSSADPVNVAARRDLSVCHNNIGDALLTGGDPAGANVEYLAGLHIFDELSELDKLSAMAQRDIGIGNNKVGDALAQLGDRAGAADRFKKGLECAERRLANDKVNARARRDVSSSLLKVADMLLANGKFADALIQSERSLAIRKEIADADIGNMTAKRDQSIAHDAVAKVHDAMGHRDLAVPHYAEFLKISKELEAQNFADVTNLRNLSIAFEREGDVALEGGDLASAMKNYEESMKRRKAVAATDSSNHIAQRDVSSAYIRLGGTLLRNRQPASAQDAFENALAIRRKLWASVPSNVTFHRDLGIAQSGYADSLMASGDSELALENYSASRQIAEEIGGANPEDSMEQFDVVVIYGKIGGVFEIRGNNVDDSADTRRGNYHKARTWYVKEMTKFQDMKRLGLLRPKDLPFEQNLLNNLDRCDKALAELAAKTDP